MKKTAPYFVGITLWLFFSIYQNGFDSPDEHFPTLEAAAGLLFSNWSETWEWRQGLRSWVQPFFIYFTIKPFVIIGIDNRLWLDAIARIANSIFLIPAIWAVGRIVQQTWTPSDSKTIRASQLFFALSWPLVTWGTRHGSDTFAIPFLLCGFAFFLNAFRRRDAVIAGLLLGFAFCVRYTLGVIIFSGVLLWFLYSPDKKIFGRYLLLTILSGLCVVTLLLGFDALLYFRFIGVFKIPAIEFFKFNVISGSGWFHASPWWELIAYFAVLWIPVFGWLFSLHPNNLKRLKDRSGWALGLTLISLAVFSSIRHKELRFIFPILPFSIIASVPLIVNRKFYLRLSLIINCLMLLVVILVYSEPHGALVRSLDKATTLTSATDSTLILAELDGPIPRFYMRKPLKLKIIDSETWKQVCAGDWNKLTQEGIDAKTGITVVAKKACKLSDKSACDLLFTTPANLGHKLRQLVSETVLPGFIYRCSRIPN